MTLQVSRLGLYFLLLVFTIVYQVRYPLFLNPDFLIPLYSFVCLSLLVTLVFLFYGEKFSIKKNIYRVLLPLDALCITAILYKTGLQNSLYLFFYLYLIFLSALSFQKKGALIYALFCSLLLTMVMSLDPVTDANTKTILFLMNNAAFFVVAFLSGTLSEQINILGEVVVKKDKDIQDLKNINTVIIENMKTGLIYLDSDLNISQYNSSAKEILKIKNDKNFYHFLQEIGNPSKLLKEQSTHNQEIVYDTGESKLILEVLISNLKVDNNNLGYIVIFQDITEKKKTQEQLKNQEKLAAVGQLAAGIAHEIRNPLASMSGSIQLLGDSIEALTDDQKKLISITLKETDRLNNLISEFLEYVRPNLLREDKININKLIEDSVDLLKLNKSLSLPQIDLNLGDCTSFYGNKDKLKQVLMNLLINSCQAQSKKITLQTRQIKNHLEISIKDDGSGMKEEVRKKMFEPFFTTKSKGTGLGLAIVHKILESHDANVDVESEVGRGTTIKILIPVT